MSPDPSVPEALLRFTTLSLDNFNINTIAYKHVQGHPIFLDVCVPKHIKSGSRPVSIRFHGGYLVYGSRDDAQLYPPRIAVQAVDNHMILVSCDYRLLPESSAKEVLQDLEDVWSWVHQDLNAMVNTMTKGSSAADLQNIQVSGESAGGYLALQLALSNPTGIRVVIASYPMIDMRDRHYSEAYTKNLGLYSQQDLAVVTDHLAAMKDGFQPSTRPQSTLPIAMIQHGLYLKYFGTDENLFLLDRLEQEPELALRLPFIYLHHGTSDTEVPIDGSRKFISKLRALNPEVNLRYRELEGMEHGMTSEMCLLLSGEWVEGAEAIKGILCKSV